MGNGLLYNLLTLWSFNTENRANTTSKRISIIENRQLRIEQAVFCQYENTKHLVNKFNKLQSEYNELDRRLRKFEKKAKIQCFC